MRISYTLPLRAALLCSLAVSLSGAPKIGVLLKGRNAPFWAVVEKSALETGQQLGVDVVVKMPMTEADVSVQIQLLNALAAQGANAIVIAPINKEALAVPIASIAVRGIKIVVIDTPLSGNAAPVFVGTDQEAAGRAAGKLLATLVSDTDEVSIFKHSQTSGATASREIGALAAFREVHAKSIVHSDIFASAEAGVEARQAALLLATHPATKAVLASGTPGTMAMLQVLAARAPAGQVKFVGFGFNLNEEVAAALEAGILHGWIAQQPREIGLRGVETAIDLLDGKTVPPVVSIDVFVVTKANLHEPSTQALLKL